MGGKKQGSPHGTRNSQLSSGVHGDTYHGVLTMPGDGHAASFVAVGHGLHGPVPPTGASMPPAPVPDTAATPPIDDPPSPAPPTLPPTPLRPAASPPVPPELLPARPSSPSPRSELLSAPQAASRKNAIAPPNTKRGNTAEAPPTGGREQVACPAFAPKTPQLQASGSQALAHPGTKGG
jgi:hypothetical protein